MSDPDVRPAYDPSEQLARLQRLCRLRAIALYREQALYLQVLRELLEGATRQACSIFSVRLIPPFWSAAGVDPSNFHAAVTDLIDRCSVLLTVEQLMQLVRRCSRSNGASKPMPAEACCRSSVASPRRVRLNPSHPRLSSHGKNRADPFS